MLSYCEDCGKSYSLLREGSTKRFCCKSCARGYSSRSLDKKSKKKASCLSCNKEFDINLMRSAKTFICDECKILAKEKGKKFLIKKKRKVVLVQRLKTLRLFVPFVVESFQVGI